MLPPPTNTSRAPSPWFSTSPALVAGDPESAVGTPATPFDESTLRLRTRGLSELLAMLLVTDALLIATHLLHTLTPYFADPRYSLAAERGIPEVFQYVKLYWIAIAFLWIAWRIGQRAFAAWTPIFAYLLLDDSFELHEKLGLALSERVAMAPALGLRGQDFGELAVAAIVGTLALVLLGVAYYLGSPTFRAVAHRVVLLIAILAFFGVAVDTLHVALDDRVLAERALGVLEDGGEMVVLSIACWYTVRLLLRAPRRRALAREPELAGADDGRR